MGKVIGKQGKNAKAIRTVMKAITAKEHKKVGIIFMTKSEKYYRQAFEVFALQYLLKPLTYEKIEKVF